MRGDNLSDRNEEVVSGLMVSLRTGGEYNCSMAAK